jgi:Linalool dehydratase/isomerase
MDECMVGSSQFLSDCRANAFMNSWNPSVVQKGYSNQLKGYIQKHSNGRASLNPNPIAAIIRRKAAEDPSIEPSSEEVAIAAWKEYEASAAGSIGLGYNEPAMGYILQWVSEIGDTETLKGLLKHADKYMGMTWENGGLFYKRNNRVVDEERNNIYMDPYTGNAAVGYARLNVKDGQRKMWLNPWKKGENRVCFEGLDLSEGVDVLRASWEDQLNAAVVTFQSWNGSLLQ